LFYYGNVGTFDDVQIIAAIEDPKVIRKILEHMGLATKPRKY